MKKWLCYLAVILVVTVFGAKASAGTDIGKLQPVQVVCLWRVGAQVTVRTDTGDWGTGHTLTAAVDNMKASAVGEIFLETADHLLVAPDCRELLDEAVSLLRPSCNLCLLDGEPDMEQIGQYLQIHAPEVTLIEYQAGVHQLQTLKTTDGRMSLVP